MKQRNEQLAQLSDAQRALLAARLNKASSTVLESAIPRRDNREAAPLSFGQQRLWLLEQLDPGCVVANVLRALRLTGPLDPVALHCSLTAIVRRHEALRTTIQSVEGHPVGVLQPAESVPVPVVEIPADNAVDREAEAQRLARQEASQPFDLARGPLFRAKLLRLGDEQHVLLLLMHHSVTDGWSTGVLVQELAALYGAFATGRPSTLPELPIQYADFALWQRDLLKGEVLQKHVAYWKEQLGGSLPVLDLPTDRPRPPMPSHRGARRSIALAPSLCAALRALSQREGVTLFMTLLAALKVLLARYTGQQDIVVGSPIAGRTRVETEGLIGFFVNTLVLRTQLSDTSTFRELLRQVHEVALRAYAHQDLPYEKMVEVLQPARIPNRSLLYQVAFQLRNFTSSGRQMGNLQIEPCEYESGVAQTDLDIAVQEQGDKLACWCDYNAGLFEATTVERLLGHYQTLLEAVVSNSEQRISELPLLTVAQRQQMLVSWNETRVDWAADRCLHHLFEAQVERTPEAVAVRFEDEQLTYRELNCRANQLAHHLRQLGIGPDILAGIYMDRSVEMVVGILGVLKAGGAYVPLDPSYPKQRLAFMLADAQAPVLLAQWHLLEGLPEHAAQVVCLDSGWENLSHEREENPVHVVTDRHLAYVIYTSGSTGQPKGVMVEHGAVVNHLLWMQHTFSLQETDRVVLKYPLSFDPSVLEVFGTLLAGARLIVARPGGHFDPAYLTGLIQTHGITLFDVVPNLLEALLDQPAFRQCRSLRRVFCGGDRLPAELSHRVHAVLPGVQLVNFYGPTEATISSTCWICPPGDQRPVVPIGRPIGHTQVYVLDAQMNPVPVAVPGELYIGGAGLARGYWKEAALTAERFVPNPFGQPGTRLYRTGDRARWLPDGTLEFLGRTDNQVKVRGVRIELADIEAALEQHPAVRQGLVSVHQEVAGDKRLVAYLTTHDQPAPPVAELRSFLRQQLPDYMVPAAFVFVESMPLTNNGKIDRRALPSAIPVRVPPPEAFTAPRTPLEELLAGIWTQVLGLDQVGIHEDFFTLGGHSLLAAQVMSRVRNTFQVELPLRRLFETPTVAGLATTIAQALAETAEQDVLARLVAEVEGLSEEQTHLLLQQVD